MFVPNNSEPTEELCIQQSILKIRAWSDVTSTAKAFKHWNTCMENKACKIIVIVLICLGGILAIWLLGSLLSMFKTGVTGICDFLCWCCPNRNRNRYPDGDFQRQSHYQMQQQAPVPVIQQPVYVQAPNPAMYNGRKDLHSYYEEFGSSKEDGLQIEEQAFDLNAHKNQDRNTKGKKQTPVAEEFYTPSYLAGDKSNNNDFSHDYNKFANSSTDFETTNQQTQYNPYDRNQYPSYEQMKKSRKDYYS